MLNKLKPTLAIIDSGIGGISVLKALINKYKAGNYIYFADNLNMPYGNKSNKFLKSRLKNIIGNLKDNYKVDKVIVACNTASSVLKNEKLKDIYLIDFNKNYTYLTTCLTQKNNSGITTIADKTLASFIENNIYNKPKLNKIIKEHIKKHHLNDLKTIVLGCTHYELVADLFKKNLKNTLVLNNSDFLLNKINFSPETDELTILYLTSLNSKAYIEKLNDLTRR